MKRRQFVAYLNDHGCSLIREGAKHSVFLNPEIRRTSTVPRHSEIDDFLVQKICKDLGIPGVKNR